MRLAFVVTVSVHVKLAGETGVSGISTSTVLCGENYPEVKVGESAIGRFRAAKAGMQVKWAEKRAIEARQGKLFEERA